MELSSRLEALELLIDRNGFWLVWNTFLAWLPVVIGLGLFRVWDREKGTHRRTPWWWAGLALFVLFLPNAPYVVTDLVHVRGDVHDLGIDGPVATTVLPVYGLFILSGFVAYYLALAQLGDYLDRAGIVRHRGLVLLGLHALVAVGIFLGRWSRLNSWEPVMRPRQTVVQVLDAFTWSAAPFLILTLFVVTVVGHFVTKAVAEATWRSTRSFLGRFGVVRHDVA